MRDTLGIEMMDLDRLAHVRSPDVRGGEIR